MKDVSIVVPIYNDQKSLDEFCKVIGESTLRNVNFIFVDNGSTVSIDIPNKEGFVLHRTEVNLGFGGGIQFGISKSETAWTGWMPGNMKVDPIDVLHLVFNLDLNESKVIKCRRSGRKIGARVKTYIAGCIQTILIGKRMFDTGGTPTIATTNFLNTLQNAPSDYVFESYVLYKARTSGQKIERPNMKYGQRKYGSSHWQKGFVSEIELMVKIIRNSRVWKKN